MLTVLGCRDFEETLSMSEKELEEMIVMQTAINTSVDAEAQVRAYEQRLINCLQAGYDDNLEYWPGERQ